MQYTLRKVSRAVDAALRRFLWIAALVLQHDLVLCARNRHFDQLPQITRA